MKNVTCNSYISWDSLVVNGVPLVELVDDLDHRSGAYSHRRGLDCDKSSNSVWN